jgi:hypothetical protein
MPSLDWLKLAFLIDDQKEHGHGTSSLIGLHV